MENLTNNPYVNFRSPPEAPVFTPSEEEFADPLGYIAKIRPIGLQSGIVKIKPPPDWQPPFAVNVETFKFTPRIQKLNELEAHSRIKLNFFDCLYKFWDLQGCTLKIPTVERKMLDLFKLFKTVEEEGGMEFLSRERRWAQVALRMGYPSGRGLGGTLKHHYEKLLFPFFLFKKGETVSRIPEQKPLPSDEIDKSDKDYKPHWKLNAADKQRKSKRAPKESPSPTKEELSDPTLAFKDPDIDYSANSELRKLQFFGAGPKAAVPGSKDDPEIKEEKVDNRKSRIKMAIPGAYSGADKYYCHMCGRGDGDEQMLLCDGCDDAFHTYCLVPPLAEVPKGDWRCPACVKQACSKPLEPYGFDQSKRDYTLQSFGEMADHFKASYFKMPVHRVTTQQVEREFWRLVQSLEENVMVQYGADIHAMEMGSGFPTKNTEDLLPEDEEYVTSGWNLNNLPVLEQSVLCHINADISGMKVPWCYVGMCFSSFCWHIEDHWSYSINYLHWGEPKSWYGVPGPAATKFEDAMRETAPELFEQAPDLLHQLTTIMNPNLLMAKGVPIVRTDQCAGEFVVTFPRAYHAGFNQGYNFAEAVNFCPADWLPIGRACIDHYRSLHRQCVFSHEELICKMAADPDSLDLNLAAATHQDMLSMVEEERDLRKALLDRGTINAEREAFELLPDDERQCDVCKTTCFLSSVTCSCQPSRLACLYHVEDLCDCPASQHVLRYRYTLDELPSMLHRLKVRAESYDNWNMVVRNALEAAGDEKLELGELKELIAEAEDKKFPESDLLQTLVSAVTEAEKCSSVAAQLVSKKVRTRNRQSIEGKYVAKLTLEELNCFYEQVIGLPCVIKETKSIKELLTRVLDFRVEAQEALEAETPDSEQVEALIEFGIGLDVDLPEIPKLKQVLQQARWLDEVRSSMREPNSVTLDTMRKLIESGVSLAPHPAVEKAMAELQELLTVSERWEEKARICLQARPRHLLTTLEAIIAEARNIPAFLPNIASLREAVKKAKEWIQKVESIQSVEQYAYLEVLEGLVAKGRPVPVRLDQLPQLESQVAAAKSWKERTARTFLKKNSSFTLLEILSPRTDIGIYNGGRCKKKRLKDGDKKEGDGVTDYASDDSRNSGVVAAFKIGEEKEVELMRDLRTRNMEKRHDSDAKFCVCRKPVAGFMLQCELCKDWFHSTCVSFPKSASIKNKTSQAAIMQATKEMKFLCPLCLRSRRPRLETILSLLVSLQKLPVRMVEGEALQCLTERAMAWQDRARQVLTTTEMASAMAQLSVMSQRMVEAAAREKTEKIIHAELQKAANNPELQPHLASVTQSAFGNRGDSMPGEHIDMMTNGDAGHVGHASNGLAVLTSAAKQQLLGGRNSDGHGVMNGKDFDSSKEASVGVNMDDPLSPNGGDLSPLPQPLVPAPNPMSQDIGAEIDIPSATSLGMSSEHAYSSVSKGMSIFGIDFSPDGSPRKNPRKSPLMPRQCDGPVLDVAETKRAQLEELMMEGDLLEVALDETQHIWRILQACYSRAEPNRYTDMEVSGQGLFERGRDKKEQKKKDGVLKTKEKLKRKKAAGERLSDVVIKRIKVENGMETIIKKKKMKQQQQQQQQRKKDNSGDSKEGVKGKIKDTDKTTEGGAGADVKPKLKKKKKVQGQTPAAAATTTAKTPEVGKQKEKRPKVKRERKVKEEKVAMDESDDNDEDCSAPKCLRPTGEEVNWVQCDGCLKWFHLLCEGIKKNEVSEDKEYACSKCKGGKQKAGEEASPSKPDGASSEPDFDLDKVKAEPKEGLVESPPCSPSVRAAADKAISDVVEAVAASSKERRLEAEKRVEAVESMMQLERGVPPPPKPVSPLVSGSEVVVEGEVTTTMSPAAAAAVSAASSSRVAADPAGSGNENEGQAKKDDIDDDDAVIVSCARSEDVAMEVDVNEVEEEKETGVDKPVLGDGEEEEEEEEDYEDGEEVEEEEEEEEDEEVEEEEEDITMEEEEEEEEEEDDEKTDTGAEGDTTNTADESNDIAGDSDLDEISLDKDMGSLEEAERQCAQVLGALKSGDLSAVAAAVPLPGLPVMSSSSSSPSVAVSGGEVKSTAVPDSS
ncbi:lysine-specific demethylase 5A isoform X2 [Aplysia californica]|uniref:[histone H3]-trimethyl-L-lysine(4) demethylase n=1 Tax=Aplysia californica TaxID=6500 RepID=A0ABM1AG34_APLCA|nr:lysine-specific demethylase 5A isoform X2 [Aplysia californica]